ncbi:MAG: hypothetical protein OXC07_12180 [Kistimonas sp.]|nr:hypothetical protein [Kistimonas sp.]
MGIQIPPVDEPAPAVFMATGKRPPPTVDKQMNLQALRAYKMFSTVFPRAGKSLDADMNSLVASHVTFECESFAASFNRADKGFLTAVEARWLARPAVSPGIPGPAAFPLAGNVPGSVMNPLVAFHVIFEWESSSTSFDRADKGFGTAMDATLVGRQVARTGETCPATFLPTDMGTLSGVGALVHPQAGGAGKPLGAPLLRAGKRLLTGVTTHVHSQAARICDPPCAALPGTNATALTGVALDVHAHDTGINKPPSTTFLWADPGFFAGVTTKVHCQATGIRKLLATVLLWTDAGAWLLVAGVAGVAAPVSSQGVQGHKHSEAMFLRTTKTEILHVDKPQMICLVDGSREPFSALLIRAWKGTFSGKKEGFCYPFLLFDTPLPIARPRPITMPGADRDSQPETAASFCRSGSWCAL